MAYLSHHRWIHDGVQYEVNNFHHAEFDAWCYELYAVDNDPNRNDYIEFRIPDLTPDGSFTPAPATEAVFLAHGEPKIPWPLLRRLIDLMHEYGDLVGDGQPAVEAHDGEAEVSQFPTPGRDDRQPG
ncbi:hypothetical protein [Krasilnikovia sp. MM14-A1259]|uniref:hypothetical protein n=1 Tax=Krasilnikovia sp. MM14-A1259 TaxID=3373539 RepID=UPI003806F4E1